MVAGNRISDDGEGGTSRWAVAGQGIAYKSALDATEDLQPAGWSRLCAQWTGKLVPLNLLCCGPSSDQPGGESTAGIPVSDASACFRYSEGIEPG